MLGALTLLLGACTSDTACVAEPNPAITVTAFDAGTGRMITDSASGYVELGSRRSDLIAYFRAADGTPITLASFEQTPGYYRVVVSRPGYRQYTASGVLVEDGDCYARGPTLTALMPRIILP